MFLRLMMLDSSNFSWCLPLQEHQLSSHLSEFLTYFYVPLAVPILGAQIISQVAQYQPMAEVQGDY